MENKLPMSIHKKLKMINKEFSKESWGQNFPRRSTKNENRTSPLVSSDLCVEKVDVKTVCKVSVDSMEKYQRFVKNT